LKTIKKINKTSVKNQSLYTIQFAVYNADVVVVHRVFVSRQLLPLRSVEVDGGCGGGSNRLRPECEWLVTSNLFSVRTCSELIMLTMLIIFNQLN